jgi:hypothetical protein
MMAVSAPTAPADDCRPPLRVALVLDRSGTMAGEPLESRTPAVAAAYLHLRFGMAGREAMQEVARLLDHEPHNRELVECIQSAAGLG